MKRFKFLVLIMIFVFSTLLFSSSINAALIGNTNGATLTLTPASATYYVNNNFTVSIYVNTRSKSVVTVAAYLNYDNTALQANSIDTTGTAFNTAQFETIIDQTAGQIKITLGKSTPGVNSSNALLAKVNFTAINAVSPGSDNITFDFTPGSVTDSNVILNDGLGTDILTGVNNAIYTLLPPDITPPELAQVTAIVSPTKNTKPSYTFSSTEAGTITYGGDCSAAATRAIVGNNTITFNTLANGVHDNCTIQVADDSGNQSLPLAISSFIVDTVAPILYQVTPVPTPITYKNPTYAFNSNEAGTITYGGDCSSLTTSAAVGDNIITFNNVRDGTHSNCTIRVTDVAGNQSLPLVINTFLVDTTAPTLTQVTAVPLSTNNTNPSYTFRSSEAGTITYGGYCSSLTTSAIAGNNTIIFNTLSEGQHSNCTIQLTDALGNQSLILTVSTFTIDTVAPTITEVTPVPPLLNNSRPSYTFNSTEAGTITYSGDCISGTRNAVSGDNTVIFNTLVNGVHSNCTIRVADAAGNPSNILTISSFTTDTVVPQITNVIVNRAINSATINWNTDENSTSQVNFGPSTSYASSSPLDTNLVTDHSVSLTGLKTNTLYHFRVRSRDAAGNEKVSLDYTFRTYATADLNLDGYVNSIDVGILMSYWGSTSYPIADINQDGYVNSIDAGIMMSQWLS